MEKERIKKFALDVLGCGCDRSVFDSIDVTDNCMLSCGVSLSRKILIGRRLLIYIADADQCAPDRVERILAEGLRERDGCGYNRLRLVIVASDPASLRKAYNDAFEKSTMRDEKTHIHVVGPDEAV